MSRKLSLSKISEEETENPVDEKKQLNIVTKEGNDNIVTTNPRLYDKVALNIRFITEIIKNYKPTLL